MSIVDNITNFKELATLPSVATKLIQMLEEEEVDLQKITGIIEKDPSLTAKLLRVANSPIYGTRREINNLQQAVMMIGFSKLTNIVLGVSIFSKFWLGRKKGATEIMNKFWYHSSTTGTIAKDIAKKVNASYHETEFIGGLLHQIGKLAMIQYDMGKYLNVIEQIEENELPDFEAERRVFGTDHLEVGEKIAYLWRLPEELRTVISHYPFPSQLSNHRELVASVSFAGLLSEINGADFYKGKFSDDLGHDDSWQILVESFNELQDLGIDLISNDIEKHLKVSEEFLNSLKA